MMLIRCFIVAALTWGLAASRLSGQTTQPTTVILVRHADKADGNGDVDLSAEGRARAEELARVLADAAVTAVYVSDAKRTRQTAAPISKALNVNPIEMPAAADVATDIRDNHRGDTVLVVGHSNTVPDLIARLGVTDPPGVIPPKQYDDLFVVTVTEDAATVLRLRYGVPTR